MTPPKTGGNSGQFAKGKDARRGAGKKGRSGRKSLEFKAECARLVDDEVLPKLADKLATATPDDQAWRWAAEKVLEYSKQKAAQDVNLGGQGDNPIRFTLNLGAAAITGEPDGA